MDSATKTFETQELDSRQVDQLTITLWWVKGTMDTFVTVLDTEPDPPVEHTIEVPPGTLPHEVYIHATSYLPAPPEAA